MTDIERMAREAGFDSAPDGHIYPDDSAAREPITEALTRFAALVRAHTLEQAANVAEDQSQEYEQHTGQPLNLAYQCGDAIRALGRKV